MYGIFSPFIISGVLIILSMITILVFWEENNPNEKSKSHVKDSFSDGLSELKKRDVFSIGMMESIFLGVNDIIKFSWTPILISTINQEINLGVIFICFVFGILTGTMLYEVACLLIFRYL